MPYLKNGALRRWAREVRKLIDPRTQDVILYTDRSHSPEDLRLLRERIDGLRPWFHNFEVAPDVWADAGDDGPGWIYLSDRWRIVDGLLPDVSGKTCLDVGCSSGFFSFKLSDAGASTVVAVDDGEQVGAVSQAGLIDEHLKRGVDLRSLSIYDLGSLDRSFDVVLCLGVFYHLRHPLLGASIAGRIATGPNAGQRVRMAGNAIEDRYRETLTGPRCANVAGFSLHANVAVGAVDRAGLERLCRYAGRGRWPASGSPAGQTAGWPTG